MCPIERDKCQLIIVVITIIVTGETMVKDELDALGCFLFTLCVNQSLGHHLCALFQKRSAHCVRLMLKACLVL